MKFCKECKNSFDDDLSEMKLSELRDIHYDPKLISDSRNPYFCSKFCDKTFSDREWYEAGNRISRGLQVVMGDTLASKKRAGDVLALTGGGGNEADIARDRVAMRQIMGGNASDKGLTRAVTEMQTEKKNQKRKEQRAEQRKKIDTMKAQYRAKYGVEA